MFRGLRFRPVGVIAALGTLAAMAVIAAMAASGSAATPETQYSATIEAKCVLAPGILNVKGIVFVTTTATGPESLEEGSTFQLHNATAAIDIPAEWSDKFYAEGATTVRGRLTVLEANLVGGEQEGKTTGINLATPPEYPAGLPFEGGVETEKPGLWKIPSGPEAKGSTYTYAPVKVTGAAGTNLRLSMGTAFGYEGNKSTGKGIQFKVTGYTSEGEIAGLDNNIKVSCTALEPTVLAEIPINGPITSSSSSSSSASSSSFSSTSISTKTETCTTTTPRPGNITVTPGQGPQSGGTPVVISGAVNGTGRVFFGYAEATGVVQVSPGEIKAVTPPNSPGRVTVLVLHEASQCGNSHSEGTYTYEAPLPPPTVTGVTPNYGPPTGHTNVTVTGTNFVGVRAVEFGHTGSSHVEVISSTELKAEAPLGGSPGYQEVDVTVETAAGISAINPADQYRYEIVPGERVCQPGEEPVFTSIEPSSGPGRGGASVVIRGSHLAHVTAVGFGHSFVQPLANGSETELVLTTPAGTGTVAISSGDNGFECHSGSVSYTYDPPPTVTSITPSSGYTTGGTPVTITGTEFASGATVTIGGKPLTALSVNSSAQTITGKTPPGAVGSAPVVVSDEYGTSTESTAAGVSFTYISPIETIQYNSWPLSGSITPKNLGQPITLPAGSTFSGSGELNDETGTGTEKGSISVPAFKSTVKLLGLPITLGVTLTQASPLQGAIVESTVGNETLKMPAKLNLGITSVGLLGLTLATSCSTTEALSVALGATAPTHELLKAGFSGAGTTTISTLRCSGGFLGAVVGELFGSLLSGSGASYSLAVKAPGG